MRNRKICSVLGIFRGRCLWDIQVEMVHNAMEIRKYNLSFKLGSGILDW